jgi:acetoin utilization deacetylase AcuC-like enzyme
LFGGFCYVNNAAVAAQFLVDAGWRVAVLDVDYHHGNGTQEIFLAHGDVLTVSIHADPQVDYPYFWGHADETGVGDGEGFNVNLPLPHGADSSVYFPALTAALERIRTFSPDALVLSLGVDTYREDPVGGFLLDVEDFPRVGERVGALGLPTVIVQEGGYALPVLGANVAGFLRGLIGG